ncbi:cysteine desulfurase family protein [Sphingomonas radiodurans]|uniref:cysteine desulfurase family protein n=1 Tax=Sphingomonas radiodurans TaxID=2890321 RepID=UPI001E341848|nr:aminotransferase class V-fold PLP-dependent enzyme [Sphingomonas radiodurans]WBH16652.1 aminotransferase class V-fold PLP-dependent enzyme [Sphingomonas radiodurans]
MERVLPDRLYLDHAATTPMTAAARDAVARGMANWANPSSPHAEGRAARAALENARAATGGAYGWRHEVLFTSGASESLGIALGRAVAGRRVISAVEHDAVMRAAGEAADMVPVHGDGAISLERLRETLTSPPFVTSEVEGQASGTSLVADASTSLGTNVGRGQSNGGRPVVCVQWCNSETGVRQPIEAIADVIHAAGALLLVDAAQMPPSTDLADHADFVALSAHKRGGPPGIGALLVRDLATLTPTGGQERGYRAGTENLPAALGYAAALAEPEPDHTALRARLDDAIERSGGIIVGKGAPRHPAIGSYRLPGLAANAQLIRLDLAGIAVSAGSACASGSLKPSHVLRAMGWSEAATREVIRVSFGRTTSAADVDRFIAAWRAIARSARMLAA